MGFNKYGQWVLMMVMVACLGCESTEEPGTQNPGIGGAGGVAGTAGVGATGGTAGTAGTGGVAGTAGVGATGGTAGTAGVGGSAGDVGGAGGMMAGTGGMMAGTTGGMMMPGGEGGTMGGDGGGMAGTGGSCVQTTLDNAPPGSTTPECAECLCTKCPEELDGCYPADNQAWADSCRALVQCGKTAPCCGKSCYGDYDFVTMTGNGPCVEEVYAAGGGKAAVEGMPGSCDAVGPPAGNACAASKVFGHCTATNCKAECMSPCNPADFMLPGGF